MIGEGIAAKAFGILAGGFLGLVFAPPRSISGFIRRGSSAVVFGWVFGGPTLNALGWIATTENIIASYCIAAFSSWWAMGAGKRIAQSLGSKETKDQ